MAETREIELQVEEAMNGFRKVLADLREEHAQRVAPLYEKLRMLGWPLSDHERDYARSIRRQIAQFEQSQREIERPIIDQMVKIESMRLRPLVISRDELPKGFSHG